MSSEVKVRKAVGVVGGLAGVGLVLLAGARAAGIGKLPGPSAAVTAAVERMRREPAPPDELFAVIKVSDRHGDSQQVLTRGTPDPAVARALHRPESAPRGTSYADVTSFRSDADVEISVRSIRTQRTDAFEGEPSREEQRESDLHARNAGSPYGPRLEAGLRARIASGEVDLEAGPEKGRVPVMIALRNVPRLDLPKLDDPDDSGLLWTALDAGAKRTKAIIDRKLRMAELQAPVVEAVKRAGGTVHYASWMSGLVQTELPGSAIAGLRDHSGIHSLEVIPRAQELFEWRGSDTFAAMDGEDFDVNHSGWHGDQWKHPSTSRVYLAMGEQCIDTSSPAWLTGPPGSASRALFYDCDDANCSLGGIEKCWDQVSDDPNEFMPHGHYVAGTMAGDLMDGQLPSLTEAQRRRITGTCPECRLLFMQDMDFVNRTKVHDLACEKAVDIFEESLGWSSGAACDGNGFMDDSVEGLVDCDVVYVSSAGNSGNPDCEYDCCDGASYDSCSTLYPADHPWTFAVSGIFTDDDCDTPGDYYQDACGFDDCSSRGGGDYDGAAGSASIVDLAAPWRIGSGISPGTINSGGDSLVGTSFGAPLVAGLMAEMMDWYRVHIGHEIFHDNRMRTFMLLFGDRSKNFDGSEQRVGGVDRYWGAGRVGLVPFDNLPTIINRVHLTLAKNGSYTFDAPVLPGGGLFKAVVTHDGKDYVDEPRIDLTLDPLGCNVGNMVWNELDTKSMLIHPALAGCTGVRVTIKNTGVGTSGTRNFEFASYQTPDSTDRAF
jgi:hypothetical protein